MMRSLVRFGDGASHFNALDAILDRSFPRRGVWQNYAVRSWGPAFPMDVYEDGDNYYVFASLTGVNPDNVEITALNNTLTIRGETRPVNPEGSRALLQEIGYGQFSRQISLPMALNADEVVATYEHGWFKLTIPKAPAHRQRKITVQQAPSQV